MVHRFWLSQSDYQVLVSRIEEINSGTVQRTGAGPDEGTLMLADADVEPGAQDGYGLSEKTR